MHILTGQSGQLRPLHLRDLSGQSGQWHRLRPLHRRGLSGRSGLSGQLRPLHLRGRSGRSGQLRLLLLPGRSGRLGQLRLLHPRGRSGRWHRLRLLHRRGRSDRSVPGSPAVPEDPECLSAPLAPSVPFPLAVRADPEVREVREVPSCPVGRCPSPHRTRAPASVRSDVPSCRSSPVDRSCRSSLPSDLPENSGSSVYAEGGFAVRPCAAKYRRLCATAADCGRTSAARSFHAQACLGSPNLSQQAHRPSAGA